MVTSRRIAETDRAGIEQALARDTFHPGVKADANGTLAAEDNLNQLPGGFAGAFNVIVAGTDGAGVTVT